MAAGATDPTRQWPISSCFAGWAAMTATARGSDLEASLHRPGIQLERMEIEFQRFKTSSSSGGGRESRSGPGHWHDSAKSRSRVGRPLADRGCRSVAVDGRLSDYWQSISIPTLQKNVLRKIKEINSSFLKIDRDIP